MEVCTKAARVFDGWSHVHHLCATAVSSRGHLGKAGAWSLCRIEIQILEYFVVGLRFNIFQFLVLGVL